MQTPTSKNLQLQLNSLPLYSLIELSEHGQLVPFELVQINLIVLQLPVQKGVNHL